MPSVNPFERIRSTEGKVFLLLSGLAALLLVGELVRRETGSSGAIVAVEAVLVLAYMVGGTIGTMRIVARPVRRAVDHFRRLSTGDYSKPVRTRRTDEFGDMLRALDGMRVSLAEAVAGREAAEQRYREIVERSVQGFFQVTVAGDILTANDALARMLGYESPAGLLAERRGLATRLHVDPTRRDEYVRWLKAHGALSGFESALRTRDGRIIWVSQSARVVSNERGEVEYLEGFMDDITARKEAEQLKADFVSFVTHQLRTPLAGIRWMLELAQDVEADPEVASYLDDAHASAKRLIGLVNDLLAVARLEAGRLSTSPEVIDVGEIATSVVAEVAPLAHANQQRLSIAGDNGHRVYADPQLTREALLNLLSNAVKYTPPGGTIRVVTRVDGENVNCLVSDSGIGISAEAQRHLFEKFYRGDNAIAVDTEGTGLGLYLVKLIAERSGGSVACTSSEGVGSTFTLSWPRVKECEAIG